MIGRDMGFRDALASAGGLRDSRYHRSLTLPASAGSDPPRLDEDVRSSV